MAEIVEKREEIGDELPAIPGVLIGTVEGISEDGRPLVSWPQSCCKAVAAQAVWMVSEPDWSKCQGLRAVLGFENGDDTRPLLLGLLDSPNLPTTLSELTEDNTSEIRSLRPKVLRIESEKELILECGDAKISLRADGRVVILGGYILSRSKGANKLKGGSVQIN